MFMEPTFRYRVEAVAEAPIEVVFAAVTDHESYAGWTSCDESFLETKGDPEPNGFGSVRVLRDTTSLEDDVIDIKEVTNHYWPPYLHGYRVMDTSLVRDHQGIVLLERLGDDRTKAVWHMVSTPVDPALADVLRPQFAAGIEQLVHDLCAEAGRRHASGAAR
jgi:Polyketide cyclase / dehydrase and lipid transport